MSETKTEVGGVKKKRKFQETWTKESQFSWLEYDATDNAMYCSVCKKAKKKNTFTNGCRDFQKSALTKHMSTSVHKSACDDVKSSTAIFQSVKKAEEKTPDGLLSQLRTIHYMARENIPLIKFEGLINLQKMNGASFSGVYYHHQQVCSLHKILLLDSTRACVKLNGSRLKTF